MRNLRNLRDNWHWFILGLIVALCLYTRIVGQLDQVFVNGQVWFREVDPWYHMRLVDNMMKNFPTPLIFDQYAVLGGGIVSFLPLMSWIICIPSLLFNIDSNVVGALLPPIVGALTLIPVFLIGRMLSGPGTGLMACFLVTLLPSEFFHRTLLGFTDHHALEAFLMVTYICLLLKLERKTSLKLSIIAGLVLCLYLLNWGGGLFLVAITVIWITIKGLLCKDWKEKEWLNLTYMLLVMGVLSSISYLLLGMPFFYSILALFSFLGPLVIYYVGRWNKWALLGLVIACIGILVVGLLNVELIRNMILGVFWGFETTIGEAEPTDIFVAFSVYSITWVFAILGLILAIRKKASLLFIVWCFVLGMLLLGQRRWGYYSVIPITLLCSYLIFFFVSNASKYSRPALVVVTCLFLLLPTIKSTVGITTLPNQIHGDWANALMWMRDNTPDVYETKDNYYKLDVEEKPNYEVLTWWDYGHWVIKIAHRPVIVSPTWQVISESKDSIFYTYSDTKVALEQLKGLNSRYIIVDEDMVWSKFYALLARYRQIDPKEVDQIRMDSTLMKIWREELPGFKVVYKNNRVKIYEVEEYLWK